MTAVVLLCVLLAATALGLVWRRGNGRMRTAAARPAADAGPTPDAGDADGAGDANGAGDRRVARAGAVVDPAVLDSIGVTPASAPVTLVQFSSAFCQPCRATRQVLGQVTDLLPEVAHVEVDAESHLDAVRALNVMRTPTVLVLDRDGRLVGRASGLPRKADVVEVVAALLAGGGGPR